MGSLNAQTQFNYNISHGKLVMFVKQTEKQTIRGTIQIRVLLQWMHNDTITKLVLRNVLLYTLHNRINNRQFLVVIIAKFDYLQIIVHLQIYFFLQFDWTQLPSHKYNYCCMIQMMLDHCSIIKVLNVDCRCK